MYYVLVYVTCMYIQIRPNIKQQADMAEKSLAAMNDYHTGKVYCVGVEQEDVRVLYYAM